MTTDYQKQAQDFLAKAGASVTSRFVAHDKYFPDDKEARDIYEVTISRLDHNKRTYKPYTFRFGQSIACSGEGKKRKAPTAYDVLACLTKYDPGTFNHFCGDYGCDTDSRRALKLYLDIQEEWSRVKDIFHDVLDELQEIN